MLPSRLMSDAAATALWVRAQTLIPLEAALRRASAARSSGAAREAKLADYHWWRGEGAQALEHWRTLARLQSDRPDWPIKIAQATKDQGDIEAAEQILLEAKERGLASDDLDIATQRYQRLWGRSNSAVADAEATVAAPSASQRKLFFAAFYLLAHNRLEEARAGLERVREGRGRLGALARGHLGALELLASRRAEGLPDIRGSLSAAQSSIEVRAPGSDTLVVGFALPEGTIGLSVNAVHAMLSSKAVNGLYLYDSRQIYHLAGTDRFGPGYAAMIAGIRAYAAQIGARRLITVGGSATGYTALRAGLDLDADGVLVFSAATMLRADAAPENVRGGGYVFQRLKQQALPMMKDLRPLLSARRSCRRIEVYYGSDEPRDIMQVGNIAGIPGVALHPIKGFKSHDCLTEMAARGYRDLLSAFEAA
jgi:hypothetical protein